MNIGKLNAGLLAALLVAATTGIAVAQQPPAKSAPEKKAPAGTVPAKKDATGKALMEKPQYDAYEPSMRIRTRRMVCIQDEIAVDAFCAKKCKAGYQMEFIGTKRVRCRSQTPLPPGVFPGPVTKQATPPPVLVKPQPYKAGDG